MKVLISPIAPRSLPSITDSDTVIDNGSNVQAGPVRSLERMANHLIGGRPVCAAGSCTPFQVSSGGSSSRYFEVAREAFSDRLRVLVMISTETDQTAAGTLTVTTSLAVEAVSVSPSPSAEYFDAVEHEVLIDFGSNVAADMGSDTVEVAVSMSARGAMVWGITLEPVGNAAPYGQGYIET